MAFITPTGWTRLQGFPNIQSNKDGASLTDSFYATYDLLDIFQKLPEIDSLYDQESVITDLAAMHLTSTTIEPTESKNHALITLVYQPLASGGGGGGGGRQGVAEYFLENGTLEKPLESKTPEYRTKWNYDLWEFVETDGGASAVPAFASTATDKSDASGEAKENSYAWTKDKPGGGYISGDKVYDWIKVQDRTKPGVDSYIVPSPVVQERKWYSDKVSANNAGATVGTLVTPDEVFGIAGGEWLVMSATVQVDGRKYLVERSFQYADDWDGDLYS